MSDTTAASDSGIGSEKSLSPPETDTSSPEATSPKGKTSSANQKQQKTWVRTYALPPCRVCGRDGSGLHYGVNTCNPCKGFFQRSFIHCDKYVCRKDNRCQLLKIRWKMCPSCRLEKCLSVGMSKAGIRHGRYLLDKKLKDTEEVKQLQSSQALVTRLVNEERKRPSVEKFVTCLSNSRHRYSKVCDRYEEMLCNFDLHYSNQYDMSEWLIEDMLQLYASVPTEGFNVYYQFEEVVKRGLIKFAKTIPGFRDLLMDDQMVLLQDFHCECRYIHAMGIYKDVFVDNKCKVTNLMGEVFGAFCMNMYRRYIDLELRPEEIAVLMAFVLTYDGNSRLKEPRMVEAIHNQLLDTLQWLLNRNHPKNKRIFCKIVELLTIIRSFTKLDEDMRIGLLHWKNLGIAEPPQLLKEMTPSAGRDLPFDTKTPCVSLCERYIP